ncbi:MAG TPA: SRPBCC family protein [Caldimonas sp.]|nr:SRPBCC family protein [Caldimonas sp.]HEX4235242.1 SRPBCC family protein [Caldimonas sp.]
MTQVEAVPGPEGSAVHSTFRIEQTYPHSAAEVFRAFAQKDLVRRWRVEDDNCVVHEFAYDFRIGGSEVSRFSFAGGPDIRLDAQFQDIVPDRRIVFVYRMAVEHTTMSVSLATVELTASSDRTLLTFTEQGVFFDGIDSAQGREEGTRALLEKLAAQLLR